MVDVARSMTGLMKQNKELKVTVRDDHEKIEKLNSYRKNLTSKIESQNRSIDTLVRQNKELKNAIQEATAKNRELEVTANKVDDMQRELMRAYSKVQSLENAIHSRDNLVKSLKSELEAVRAEKANFADILKDAKALLGEEDYNSGNDYYRYVA